MAVTVYTKPTERNTQVALVTGKTLVIPKGTEVEFIASNDGVAPTMTWTTPEGTSIRVYGAHVVSVMGMAP